MAKIKYESDGLFIETRCPFGIANRVGVVGVNSHYCTHNCKYYRSTDLKHKTVVCLADCSSRLEEILSKIDVVIANELLDDICFEDFLGEIREGIAEVLDSTQDNTREEEQA